MSERRRDADGDDFGGDDSDGGGPWTGWWDEEEDEEDGDWAGIASLLVLGLGLASLFGLLPIGPFWAIFAIGFAVVVPIVAVLESRYRGTPEPTPPESGVRRRAERAADEDESVADALDSLRDRYARGDLSDEQFEHKLEVLLETDTPENARERTARRRSGRERERSREERERESSERET
ncbi:NADH:ubiquinone oxidoreductase subunit 2 (chain n) [Halogeometricum pallidum JCM 14848]|uniref:NADH:ubiquinone oxidoreductase subunit 2 (Chain n) n=1 Tax=Halogeometricum pallidum JCM 14848 TaxID=1227487 RepID=M0D818_HALPD|nr:SHOCT domain-containing protein [Halogeometricum pallidum]ELZ30973.1 NADH:ubiquinone oxidoreductase subunit 2 (chain n) [Halogeometricum pallidum JCM 14848]